MASAVLYGSLGSRGGGCRAVFTEQNLHPRVHVSPISYMQTQSENLQLMTDEFTVLTHRVWTATYTLGKDKWKIYILFIIGSMLETHHDGGCSCGVLSPSPTFPNVWAPGLLTHLRTHTHSRGKNKIYNKKYQFEFAKHGAVTTLKL